MSQCQKDGRWSFVNLTCTAVLPTKERESSAKLEEFTKRDVNSTGCVIAAVVITAIIMLILPFYIVYSKYFANNRNKISAINTVRIFSEIEGDQTNTTHKVSINNSVDNKTFSTTGR